MVGVFVGGVQTEKKAFLLDGQHLDHAEAHLSRHYTESSGAYL